MTSSGESVKSPPTHITASDNLGSYVLEVWGFLLTNLENNKKGSSNLQNIHRLYEASLNHQQPEGTC